MSLVLRRVPLIRPFHSSPPHTARQPSVTKKPFSELPKRPPAPLLPSLDVIPAADSKKAPRRHRQSLVIANESAAQVAQDSLRSRRGRKPKTVSSAPSETILLETGVSPRQPRNSLATEILSNLSKFPHCILLTRVGQFYESYFDQANQVARLLGIKLTSRVWDKQDVPMCGFPIMHLDKHLKVLVQQHKLFVSMCEEFPRYTNGQKPEFNRRVVRIITPGTLIDEPFLNSFENNFLLAISANSPSFEPCIREVGLAWIDVSTGEFFTKTIPLDGLKDELARISPREIVLAQQLRDQPFDPIRQLLEDEGNFLTYVEPSDSILCPCGPTYTLDESAAVNILTTYMQANLMEHMPQLSVPSREGTDERMQIDSHTIKALEIRESAREGGLTGSLISVIKRTVTSSGMRSLTRRLCLFFFPVTFLSSAVFQHCLSLGSPSTSQREIEARQSLVAFFYQRPHTRDDVVRLLQDSEDVCRIVQRFLSCKGEPKDLLAINRTIQVWTSIRKRIELEKAMERPKRDGVRGEDWSSVNTLLSKITSLHDLSTRITLALEGVEFQASSDEFAEGESAEGGQKSLSTAYGLYKRTIRPEFSGGLAALHDTLRVLLERRRTLERDLQAQYSAPSLTLRTNPAQGMHVHIGRAKRDDAKIKTDPSFIVISENASTSSYFYQVYPLSYSPSHSRLTNVSQPWSQLGGQIVETTTAITNVEKEIFDSLRDEVKAFSTQLHHNARIMDELDVALGFANLAVELRFVRPVIKDDATYEVTDGRHPTVELGLLTSGRVFTPNSVALKPHSRLHIITGPNMAGKSTFLRQTALIAILAQTGSFVPAEHAVVGIVDKLFSRVGAKDDIFRDRSTFMVEMVETAEILRRATAKSLVIMDEVGRGTTVKDGLAIAFATVHHLVVHNRCRALFATHFHELADLLAYGEVNHHGNGVFRDVGFFCTDDNFFTYSHRLRPGVNRNSHGLKVAQLAGMPDSALLLAKNALAALQRQHFMNPKELSGIGKELTTVTTGKQS
ncbi:muts domain V-domain-containing protein [Lanmaoa asiatica]|nr:muts domain V-domain-containing protein [Lanmaoa asiatica]